MASNRRRSRKQLTLFKLEDFTIETTNETSIDECNAELTQPESESQLENKIGQEAIETVSIKTTAKRKKKQDQKQQKPLPIVAQVNQNNRLGADIWHQSRADFYLELIKLFKLKNRSGKRCNLEVREREIERYRQIRAEELSKIRH